MTVWMTVSDDIWMTLDDMAGFWMTFLDDGFLDDVFWTCFG